MKKDIAKFVVKCSNGQQVKVKHQKLGGLAQTNSIPIWKWKYLNMDFITGLPYTHRQFDSIWVIMDRMTKSAHFLPVKTSFSAEEYAKLYIWEMKSFQKGLGTQVKLSTTFHPQIDGQVQCTIQTLEYILRACVIDFKGNLDDNFLLIEFSYNNSNHLSIRIALFEALYARRCRYSIDLFEVGEVTLIGPEFVHEAMEKVRLIHGWLKTAQNR
ncbi:hypothetical protein MTR67_007625 [Solanum verrucosum]|uniref:Uncharacterized protein n=1 Tax=Solanum verrucosum TaxID=315347 RepID=A0AAF0Q2B9_SOLVR|nr:hypothetical protein MTR67_007625 [Solanum verrucosum]